MLATNQSQFRSLAWQEIRKYHRKNMVYDAATLMDGTEAMAFNEVGRPGIRAQLVERRINALVMDFVVEGDAQSTHVLNAISPAWTSLRGIDSHGIRLLPHHVEGVKHGRLNPNPNGGWWFLAPDIICRLVAAGSGWNGYLLKRHASGRIAESLGSTKYCDDLAVGEP